MLLHETALQICCKCLCLSRENLGKLYLQSKLNEEQVQICGLIALMNQCIIGMNGRMNGANLGRQV